MPRSSTDTLIKALRILAGQIQAPDDVPAAALREAAERLEELEATVADKSIAYSMASKGRDEAIARAERAEMLVRTAYVEGWGDGWQERDEGGPSAPRVIHIFWENSDAAAALRGGENE